MRLTDWSDRPSISFSALAQYYVVGGGTVEHIDRTEAGRRFDGASLFDEPTPTSRTSPGHCEDQPTPGFAWLFTDEPESSGCLPRYATPQLEAVASPGDHPHAQGARPTESAAQRFVNRSLAALLCIVAAFVTIDTVGNLTTSGPSGVVSSVTPAPIAPAGEGSIAVPPKAAAKVPRSATTHAPTTTPTPVTTANP